MEQYPLIEEGYRAWLKHFQPEEFIGIRADANECALARYLRANYSRNFQVVWHPNHQHSWYRAEDEEDRTVLPEWANQEAQTFDVILSQRMDVTKEEYDEYLKTE